MNNKNKDYENYHVGEDISDENLNNNLSYRNRIKITYNHV